MFHDCLWNICLLLTAPTTTHVLANRSLPTLDNSYLSPPLPPTSPASPASYPSCLTSACACNLPSHRPCNLPPPASHLQGPVLKISVYWKSQRTSRNPLVKVGERLQLEYLHLSSFTICSGKNMKELLRFQTLNRCWIIFYLRVSYILFACDILSALFLPIFHTDVRLEFLFGPEKHWIF